MTQLPHLALAAGAHDRVGERRGDDSWLAQRWADPDSRVLVLADGRVRHQGGRPVWVSPAQAPTGLRLLLGERDGRAWFAVLADSVGGGGADSGTDEAAEWADLRSLLGGLAESDREAPLVFHAVGLAQWHRVTSYCARCAGALESRAEGHELHCLGACGSSHFPRTDPAVIMAITWGEPASADEAILLGRHAAWPEGRFSTLAGFCEPGESLEDAVRREVLEEVGVRVGDVTYFGNQPWPFPASLMLGFTGRALTRDIVVDQRELEAARWVTREQMRAEAEAGSLILPGGVSISRSLVETWYGGPLPGSW